MAIKETELIIRPDGAIYHLNLRPGDVCENIITVGDPERVALVSRHFDEIYFKKQSREIISHRGRIGTVDVLVISTGMGTDNIEIVMNELDALVNIDLDRREIKDDKTSLNIVRIGTSGSISDRIPVGSMLASKTGTGLDNLMHFYDYTMDAGQLEFSRALKQHLALEWTPYVANADPHLLSRIGKDVIHGNTLTCPGFYAPQGRHLRFGPVLEDYLDRLESFEHSSLSFTNIEMETSAMYAMGAMMGHRMLSMNAIIANRITGEFAENPHAVVDELILLVLERMAN
ncbi:nucleoside phosphorylase [Fulvivirga sedimenti]|uniref:Uridine phosphorylase n=1 Tax=Fulvivirga sedimenti TaxID=2879465 RepID=A0A9X1KVS4_9BACT|nr:nucleoside phosphorylase [Fulvivirga sedimenti]MCA6074000.1 nucleoside phosphorylase [Fulvivirga sedimenti]